MSDDERRKEGMKSAHMSTTTKRERRREGSEDGKKKAAHEHDQQLADEHDAQLETANDLRPCDDDNTSGRRNVVVPSTIGSIKGHIPTDCPLRQCCQRSTLPEVVHTNDRPNRYRKGGGSAPHLPPPPPRRRDGARLTAEKDRDADARAAACEAASPSSETSK